MGGKGSGTPRIQTVMGEWYRQHQVPPSSIVRFQYGVRDSLIVGRVSMTLEQAAMIDRALPRLDMLVITPGDIRIVELKPEAQLRDVGQAMQYAESLKRDVQLKDYLDRPMRLVLVVLKANESVRALVEGQGMQYLVIPPSEVDLIETTAPSGRTTWV